MTPNDTGSAETGQDLRDAGTAAVLDADAAVHRNYREHIERVMDDLVDSGRPFTADDVQRELPDDVRKRMAVNLVPALFSSYSGSGRIVQTGWSTSTRSSRHTGVQRCWVGAWAAKAAS